MCDKLCKRAVNELDLVKGERLSRVKRSNKRAREVRDVSLRTSRVQSVKLYKVNIINELGF
jgi:hypothetical protein